MSEVVFYFFAAVAIVSAVLAITRKNAVASALWLVLMFFSLAGVYVMLEAYFVAVVQVLVYAGAIMVLFLFVIMLLDLRSEELSILGPPDFRKFGLIGAGAFLALAVGLIWQSPEMFTVPEGGGPDGSAETIGFWLFNRWVLAFEVASVLLLAAILGAVVLTKRRLT